jgi:drug/metabolite transporter (DMT)-like permease
MKFVIIFSISAAFLNAISVVVQRKVAGKPAANELFRVPFIKNLTLNKLWLVGFGLQVMAFFLQAAALSKGSLIIVEPILTIDLVFILLILHFRYHVRTGLRGWVAVLMVCVGLSGLLASAQPHHGHQRFEFTFWVIAIGSILLLINLAVFIVRRTESSQRRSLIMGVAAGLSFALSAVFTKLTVIRLHFGFLAEFTGWPIYALLLAGILSIIMTQNTYGAGPVVISQPTMEITEPIISIVMAMLLFGDTIDLHPTAIMLEAVTGLLACVGIWLLGRSDSMQLQNT